MKSLPYRVLLADDHAIFRMGLSALLKQKTKATVLQEAVNGEQALALIETLKPEIAILDIRMPAMSGIDVLRQLRSTKSSTRVLLLSEWSESSLVRELAREKPDGYVLKSECNSEVCRAIEVILRGGKYFSPRAGNVFLEALSNEVPTARDSVLSKREWEIARCVELGMSNKEIAYKLKCSEHTIKAHKANVMKKVGVSNSAGIASWASKAVKSFSSL